MQSHLSFEVHFPLYNKYPLELTIFHFNTGVFCPVNWFLCLCWMPVHVLLVHVSISKPHVSHSIVYLSISKQKCMIGMIQRFSRLEIKYLNIKCKILKCFKNSSALDWLLYHVTYLKNSVWQFIGLSLLQTCAPPTPVLHKL